MSIQDVIDRAREQGAPHARHLLEELVQAAEARFDLTRESDQWIALATAEVLGELFPEQGALDALEAELAARTPAVPVSVQLAVKLARSRRSVARLEEPAFLSIVFAVYKEHQRIRTTAEHPHGEDFLNRKVAQLDWLCAASPNLGYELIVVDDGCPEGSGRIVAEIAARQGLEDRVRTLFLDDAIRAGHPVTAGLASPDDSRKGGSIELGMWEAVATERPGHVVVFTDADLSTHLGQTGLLLDEIRRGSLAAVASRREPTSVVVKGGSRNDRGKLFIYLWKRLLAPLGHVTDTQCGFKAFAASRVREILTDTIEKQFAFDIELLLRTELIRPRSVQRVAIAWIDSEAESTTTEIQPYLPMLRAATAMYRRYLPPDDRAEPFARLLEEMTEESWQRLLEDIPAAITSRDPQEFGTWAEIGADTLRR